MSKLIYLASPYTATSAELQKLRATQVSKVAAKLIKSGLNVFCPIAHSATIAQKGNIQDTGPEAHKMWMRVDLSILSKCTDLYVLKLPGYKESKGVREEIDFAIKHSIPIKYISEDTYTGGGK